MKEIDESIIVEQTNNEIKEIYNNMEDLVEIQKALGLKISGQFENINLIENNTKNTEINTKQSEKILEIIKENKINQKSRELFIILLLAGLAIGTPLGFIATTTATGALIGLSTGGIAGAGIGYFFDNIGLLKNKII